MDFGMPCRMFLDRDEPSGDRVNQYFKLNTIATVLNVLKLEEVDIIRPAFGKLLDVYSKPTFSGKLAHFLFTRQLQIRKKFETWVIFAGKPIRFSLREFGIVTGLGCNPLPKLPKEKLKAPAGVAPYWFELFGGESNVTGESLTKMFKRSRSLPSETRIKYACLLLVDGFLCRRSHHMKISKEHVEMIRELGTFLCYPWGRYAFNMTIESIKSRSISQLAQPTVAVQGFIHALQLVFLEAVPQALSAIGECVDPESGEEEDQSVLFLKLDKVWLMEGEDEVPVLSIIPGDDAPTDEVEDFSWPNELSDVKVENMVKLIEQGTMFTRDMFVGGISGVGVPVGDVAKSPGRGKRKAKAKVRSKVVAESESSGSRRGKRLKRKAKVNNDVLDSRLVAAVSAQLKAEIRGDFKVAEANLDSSLRVLVPQLVADCFKAHMAAKDVGRGVADAVPPAGNDGSGSPAEEDSKDGDESDTDDEKSTGVDTWSEIGSASKDKLSEEVDGVSCSDGNIGANVSKCINNKFTILREQLKLSRDLCYGPGLVLKEADLVDLPKSIPPNRPEVMDSAIMVLRETILTSVELVSDPRADILPCQFVVTLAKLHSKFKKEKLKLNFDFGEELIESVQKRFEVTRKQWVKDVDFLYFPFNIDKNRWIGVMVDLLSSSLTVFDSTSSERRGSRLREDVDFLCEMLPFLIRKASVNDNMASFNLHPLSFFRDTMVVQASDRANTGMLSLLFIEAHARGGLEKVYLVKEEFVRERAEQLAVEMCEHCFGDLL